MDPSAQNKTSCIRQEVGERALADQEAREAARVDVVPEDGVPAVDLVGAVSGSSVSRVLLVKPRQVVAWSRVRSLLLVLAVRSV